MARVSWVMGHGSWVMVRYSKDLTARYFVKIKLKTFLKKTVVFGVYCFVLIGIALHRFKIPVSVNSEMSLKHHLKKQIQLLESEG